MNDTSAPDNQHVSDGSRLPAATAGTRQRRTGLLIAMVLAGGAAAAYLLLVTAPTTRPEDETRPARLVQTVVPEAVNVAVHVSANGTVIPAREVMIKPEVAGRVVRCHPELVPGGHIAEGEELFGIEADTYRLALTEQEAALEEARFELEVERGRQVVAQREWQELKDDLSDADTNQALVLREPHLRRTQALIRKAENAIDQARLNLQRTSIPCPFNAVVLEESIEIGQVVEARAAVATLVGADEFWVQVAVPLEELRHIRFPDGAAPGARARITVDAGDGSTIEKDGHVLRLLGDLDDVARMVRLLVSVPDPLQRGSANEGGLPLLLGNYVDVAIDAGVLEGVLVIERNALREGDQIWIVDLDDKLQMRDAKVLWKRRQDVLIAADVLRAGERIVVSSLRTATPGMAVTARPAPAAPAISGRPAL